jgi:hypothetical protein
MLSFGSIFSVCSVLLKFKSKISLNEADALKVVLLPCQGTVFLKLQNVCFC